MTLTTIEVTVLPDGRMDRRNAARYIGVAEKTLAHWASQKKGPRYIKRCGRTWYFQRVLDEWLASGEILLPQEFRVGRGEKRLGAGCSVS